MHYLIILCLYTENTLSYYIMKKMDINLSKKYQNQNPLLKRSTIIMLHCCLKPLYVKMYFSIHFNTSGRCFMPV